MVDLIQQIRKNLSLQEDIKAVDSLIGDYEKAFDTFIKNYTVDLKAELEQANNNPDAVSEKVAQRAVSLSFDRLSPDAMDQLLDKVQNAFDPHHSPRLRNDAKLTEQQENVLQAGNMGRKIAYWEMKSLDTPAINRMRQARDDAFRAAINDPNKANVAARAELSYRLALKAAPKLRPEAPKPAPRMRYEPPKLKPM